MDFYITLLLALTLNGVVSTRWMENRFMSYELEADCREVLVKMDDILRKSLEAQFSGRDYEIKSFDCLTLERIAELNDELEAKEDGI